ncbi:hypothetical protein KQI42_03655 [Tissierella sp. MSJ-40]|uniref:TnsE C-terminal domain-containing protein n=1 Tax=Tissierella simiarum TaxID=2841534 RepID=A0ABS6E2F1_9FIRM|nr:hypothetical protein [Tissierella simiarum]
MQVIINDLPEGKRGKKFTKLKDGQTNRKYVAGRIVLKDKREFNLIEIEREEKSLSMLLLCNSKRESWASICFKIVLD